MTKNEAARWGTAALLALILSSGCGSTLPSGRPHPADPTETGWVSRSVFQQPLYAPFRVGYDTARVAQEFLPLLRSTSGGITVTVFFGGWCDDSRREVPRFLKVADAAGIADSAIRFYALDRTKKSADGLTERFAIEKVPTFIVLKGGEEVGRIVESPAVSMEADLLTIFAGSAARSR